MDSMPLLSWTEATEVKQGSLEEPTNHALLDITEIDGRSSGKN
jgi:hypothetical protein